MSKRVYFIRHNLGRYTDEFMTLQPQVNHEKYIGFCYEGEGYYDDYNNYSQTQQNQNGFNGTYNRFKELNGTTGILVLMEFGNKSNKNKFFIGRTLGHQVTNIEIPSLKNNYFAGLKIVDVKEYNYIDYPVLLASLPQQVTTCKRNEVVSKIIECIYYGVALKHNELHMGLLHYKGQELLCSNFLQNKELVEKFFSQNNIKGLSVDRFVMKYNTLKVGGNLKEYDLCGKNLLDKSLFAQVCYGEKGVREGEFYASIISSPGSTGIMFSSKTNVSSVNNSNYLHVPIEDLFQFMLKECPEMIYDLIGLPPQLIDQDPVKAA